MDEKLSAKTGAVLEKNIGGGLAPHHLGGNYSGGDLIQVLGRRGRRVSDEIFFAVPFKLRNLGGRHGLLSLGTKKMLSQCRTLYNGSILN